MVIETAVSISAAWLWNKLADGAVSIDEKNAIKKAIEKSINDSYSQFQTKHLDLSEKFFNQEFLEKHVCPEILTYLTRHRKPDIKLVVNALPVNALLVSGNSFQDEIVEFFDMVMDSMKGHAILQNIINSRQIEETNQTVKEIQNGQESIVNLMDDGVEKINLGLTNVAQKQDEILSQNSLTQQQFSQLHALFIDNLPNSKGDEFNQLLSKQLDRSRDFINNGQINDAYDLLISLEEEINSSDDYTRFRWHTNIGACFLAKDKRQQASEEYFIAYNFAKTEEKAIANRIRAFLIIDKFNDALAESEQALISHPESGMIWALHINAKQYLNEIFDESLLPRVLINDNLIRLILSDIRFRKNQFEEAFELAKNVYEQDNNSSEAKRVMLVSALSWVTVDNVKSYYKQFGSEQSKSLEYALNSFGEPIEFLQKMQSRQVFTEVAHNLSVAAELLGDDHLRNNITSYSLTRYPEESIFIWFKVKELKTLGDIDAIRKLTDDKLEQFEKPLLFTLAEISANKGDVEWNGILLDLLNTKLLDENELNELLGIEICAIWKSGDANKALSIAKENLPQIYSYSSLITLYTRMLHENGDFKERDRLLNSCKKKPDDLSSVDIIEYADLLYDFGYYFDAANLYSQIVKFPSDDYLTVRYLNSLLNSEQRAQVKDILDSISDELRNQSKFKQIEANLARISGDLDTLEKILKEELALTPTDSGAAVGYLSTLYRENKIDELKAYLSSNPNYEPLIEINEIEVAKFQMEYGFEYEAMARMYELFRLHPTSVSIAGHFLLLLLLIKQNEILSPQDEFISSCNSVVLENNGNEKTIVIEPSDIFKEGGWPECVSEKDELAQKLIGLKIGDSIDIDTGFGINAVTIVKIESIFKFALNIAHKILASSVSSVGPVWSVNVRKEDGEFDFTPILETVKSRKKHVEKVFNIYKGKHIPLQTLADLIGTDLITLILEWPYSQYDLFVANGTHEERENSINIINNNEKPYILDLSALIELHRLEILKYSTSVLGTPLITASLREQLLRIIQIHEKLNPNGFATEINGDLAYQDVPKNYLEDRSKFLNTLLNFVDEYCEVVPVYGPTIINKEQENIAELIGYASHDLIYLALERDAVIVSEDGGLRELALSLGVKSTVWIQPLLMALRDRKYISVQQYSKNVLDKLNRRHSFTSVAANDLLLEAKQYPRVVSPVVESVIQTFRSSKIDFISAVRVGSEFLWFISEYVDAKILYQYYKLIMEALSFERGEYINHIHESLRASIVRSFSKIKQKKIREISRKFGNILDVPRPSKNRIKPLLYAVRIAFQKFCNEI